MCREFAVQKRFKIAKEPHAFCKRIPNKNNSFIGVDFQRLRLLAANNRAERKDNNKWNEAGAVQHIIGDSSSAAGGSLGVHQDATGVNFDFYVKDYIIIDGNLPILLDA